MSTGVLAWEKPAPLEDAPTTSNQIDTDALRTQLQARKGKWALVKEYPTPAAHDVPQTDGGRIRKNALANSSRLRCNVLVGGFEVKVGATRSGLLGIFARAV